MNFTKKKESEMGFRTDGSSHKSGVHNEEKLVKKLRESYLLAKTVWPKCPPHYTVQHLGGTKNKADLVMNDKKVSVKKKEGIKTGSYDWINSSAQFKKHEPCFRHTACVLTMPTSDVEDMRARIKEATHRDLDSLDTHMLWELLRDSIIAPNKGIVMSLVDAKDDTIYNWDFEDTPLYAHYKKKSSITIKEPAKAPCTSRTLLFDGKDIGLRLRIALNNGVSALLGLSKSNKSSIPVIKFQQDKVDQLLKRVGEKGKLRTATL
jgi:hypothetical protein